jgi:hypothetical protein
MKPVVFAMAAVLSMAGLANAQSPPEVIEQAVAKSHLKFPGRATLIK